MSVNSAPGRRQERPERVKKGRRGAPVPWLIAVALILAAFAGFLYYLLQPVTFTYRGMTMEAVPGVAVNRYDPDGFYTDEKGRVQYTSKGASARAGIDVSYSQGDIDWAAVAADGVDFAIIRLGYRGYTQGALNTDTCYEANFQGARDAGLDVGVYFFSQALTPEEAQEEAQFVLDTLNGSPLEYPVVFDWEFITHDSEARTHGMDGETLTQCAAAFCQVIEEGGYTPAVYFNRDMGYLYYDLSQLDQYPFWLADYDSVPDFYYRFQLWQYTHTGTVAGIEGNVDLNLDFGPVYDPS